jgi:hypothetical protein
VPPLSPISLHRSPPLNNRCLSYAVS